MKRKLTKQEALLLRLTVNSEEGLIPGFLTVKYGASVREIFHAFKKLNADGLLRMDGDLIVLTSLGRSWINENQNLFAFTGEKTWRRVPPDFQAPQIQPFKPYAPRRSRLRRAAITPGQAAGGD